MNRSFAGLIASACQDLLLAGMIQENRSNAASTDSYPAPETGNIKERVQTLRQNVRELVETLAEIDKNLREAAGKTQK